MEPDSQFDAMAARYPFFAVIPTPSLLADELPAGDAEAFFRSGDDLVAALVRQAVEHLDPQFSPTAILDYGCGNGRLTGPLASLAARRSGDVVAVDRSAALAEHARRRMDALGVRNVRFASPQAVLQAQHPSFDLAVCYWVLQRLRPADGLRLVERLLRLVLPGGLAIFQFPVASSASGTVRAIRRLREALPPLNRLAQWWLGHPSHFPLIPSHTYDSTKVLEAARRSGATACHVLFDDQGDLQGHIVFCRVGPTRHESRQAHTGSDRPPDTIDVRALVESHTIEELNVAAENYFASLTTWEHHLAKPLATIDEAPEVLADAAVALHALRLFPGARVLDFGCGTGWLSRALAQLGAQVVGIDVSATALQIGAELLRRQPLIGERSSPEFRLFDGLRIPADAAAFDRVVCLHAFHHVPNPETVLAEFARVLAPGGRAVFIEPGERHSTTAQSQHEMRMYGVVENDVDVHRVWHHAQQLGFREVVHLVAGPCSIEMDTDRFEGLRRGDSASDDLLGALRTHLRNVSYFVLVKDGDSPQRGVDEQLSCLVHVFASPAASAGRETALSVRVTNTGSTVWGAPGRPGGVVLGVRVFASGDRLCSTTLDPAAFRHLERPLSPGEGTECTAHVPALPAGDYTVEVDCVADGIAWFSQRGSGAARLSLRVGP